MPLEILGLMVVVGLALVIGAVHLSGGSEKPKPMNERDVIHRFRVDFPAFAATRVVLVDAGNIAFLFAGSDNAIGLVEQMGRHRLTRLLDQRSLKGLEKEDSLVRMWFQDVTLPPLEFEITDSTNREKLFKSLTTLSGG